MALNRFQIFGFATKTCFAQQIKSLFRRSVFNNTWAIDSKTTLWGSCIPKALHIYVYTYSCAFAIHLLSITYLYIEICHSSSKVFLSFEYFEFSFSILHIVKVTFTSEVIAIPLWCARWIWRGVFYTFVELVLRRERTPTVYQLSISESDGKCISKSIYW